MNARPRKTLKGGTWPFVEPTQHGVPSDAPRPGRRLRSQPMRRARRRAADATTGGHMLSLEPGIYLRVQELPNGPTPFPLRSGFGLDTAYRALGLFNPSETSDAYFILSNDRDEIWFICNRHLRCLGLLRGSQATRMPLEQARTLLRMESCAMPDALLAPGTGGRTLHQGAQAM
ncbi:hypothetical protein [Pseudorhodoferax sp.]|uniref:hypothetical protein n=1 Tax=Pseudorhodoferax sp. TaxID=1993553 RepID=UPI0039E317D6